MSKKVARRASQCFKRGLVLGAAVAGLGLLAAGRAGAATTYTWVGLGDGSNWADQNNWNPVATPIDTDILLINAATALTTNNNLSLSSTLGLGAVELTGAGHKIVNGNQLYLDGGTTVNPGSGNVANVVLYNALGSTADINSRVALTVTAKNILNYGTLNLNGGLDVKTVTTLRGSGTTTIANGGYLGNGAGTLNVGFGTETTVLNLHSTFSTFTGTISVKSGATLDIQTSAALGGITTLLDGSTLRISGPNIVAPGAAGFSDATTTGNARVFNGSGTPTINIPDPAGALAVGFGGNANQWALGSVNKTGSGTLAFYQQATTASASTSITLQQGQIANGGGTTVGTTNPNGSFAGTIRWLGGGVTSTQQNSTFSGPVIVEDSLGGTTPVNSLVLNSTDPSYSSRDYLTTISGPMMDSGMNVVVKGNAATSNVKGFALTNVDDNSGISGNTTLNGNAYGLTGNWTVQNGGMVMFGHHFDTSGVNVYGSSGLASMTLDTTGAGKATALGPVAGIMTDSKDSNGNPTGSQINFPAFSKLGNQNYGYYVGALTAGTTGLTVNAGAIALSGEQFTAIGTPGQNFTLAPASVTLSADSALNTQDANLSLGNAPAFSNKLTIRGNSSGAVLANGNSDYQFSGLQLDTGGTLRVTSRNVTVSALTMNGGSLLYNRPANNGTGNGGLMLTGNVTSTAGGLIGNADGTSGTGVSVDLGGTTRTFNVTGNSLRIAGPVNNGGIIVNGTGGELHLDATFAAGAIAPGGNASSLSVASGAKVRLSGNPVPSAGAIQLADNATLAIGYQGYLPGVAQGIAINQGFPINAAGAAPWNTPTTPAGFSGVSLGFDMAQTNGTQNGNGNSLPTNFRWGDQTNFVYSGQFYTGTGHIAFGKNIDDNVRIMVDGVQKLNDTTWNNATTTGDLNLTPGWHNIEVQMFNGGGGAGAVGQNGWSGGSAGGQGAAAGVFDGKGFGINTTPGSLPGYTNLNGNGTQLNPGAADGGNFTVPLDDGTGNLLRHAGTVPFTGTNAIQLNGTSGTIDTNGYKGSEIATLSSVVLTQANATLTTQGAAMLSLPSVTINGNANIQANGVTRISGLTYPATPLTLAMTGTGRLHLDQAGTATLPNTVTLKAQSGTISIKDLGAGALSTGAAPIVLGGGNVDLGTFTSGSLIERGYGQAQGFTSADYVLNNKFFLSSPSRAANPGGGLLGAGAPAPQYTYTLTGTSVFQPNDDGWTFANGHYQAVNGTATSFNTVNGAATNGGYGILWTGAINVPTAGQVVSFGANHDDTAVVFVDFNRNGVFEASEGVFNSYALSNNNCCGTQTSQVTFANAGQYAIALGFQNGNGGQYGQIKMLIGATTDFNSMHYVNDPNFPNEVGTFSGGSYTNLDVTAAASTSSTITAHPTIYGSNTTNLSLLKMQPGSTVGALGEGGLNFTGINFDANSTLNVGALPVRSGTLKGVSTVGGSPASLTIVGSSLGGKLIANDQTNAPTLAGAKLKLQSGGILEVRHDATIAGAVNPVAGATIDLGDGTLRITGDGVDHTTFGTLDAKFFSGRVGQTVYNGSTTWDGHAYLLDTNNGVPMSVIQSFKNPLYENKAWSIPVNMANNNNPTNPTTAVGSTTVAGILGASSPKFATVSNNTFSDDANAAAGQHNAILMQGALYIPSGQAGDYTFTTFTDDGSRIVIDGQVVADANFDKGVDVRTGPVVNLSAGYHSVSIGWFNGTGGSQLSAWFSGPATGNVPVVINPGSTTVNGTGVAQNTLWTSNVAMDPLDYASNNLIVSAAGTLELQSFGGANFGSLSLATGQLTLSGIPSPAHFTGTQLVGSVTINTPAGFNLFGGPLTTTSGGSGTLTKQGDGNTIFNNSGTAAALTNFDSNSSLQVNAGNLIMLSDGQFAPLGGTLGGATSGMRIAFNNAGGTLAFAATADGKTIAVPSDVTAFASGTVLAGTLAGQGVAAGSPGSIKVALGKPSNAINASGGTLTLGANSNYELDVNSAITIGFNSQLQLSSSGGGLVGGTTVGGAVNGTLHVQSGAVTWPTAAFDGSGATTSTPPSIIQVDNGASLQIASFNQMGVANVGGTLRTVGAAPSSTVNLNVPANSVGTLDNTGAGIVTVSGANTVDPIGGGITAFGGVILNQGSTLNLPNPAAGAGLNITSGQINVANATLNHVGPITTVVNLSGSLTKGAVGTLSGDLTLTAINRTPTASILSNSGNVIVQPAIVAGMNENLTLGLGTQTVGAPAGFVNLTNATAPALSVARGGLLNLRGNVTVPDTTTSIPNAGAIKVIAGVTDFSTKVIAGDATVVPVTSSFNTNTDNTGWQINGGAPAGISGDAVTLTLTDANNDEARSAFQKTPILVGGPFHAQFVYQATGAVNNLADGAAFVLQNDPRGASARGDGGGSLAYGGGARITPSAAIEFNIYGTSSTRYATNGDTGGYIATTPVDIRAQNKISVDLQYDGIGSLVETLTDQTTSQTFTHTYAVNIAQAIGTPTAYIGFTGATGGINAAQSFSNFSYSSTYQGGTLVVDSGNGASPAVLRVAGFTNHSLVALGQGTLAVGTTASDTVLMVTLPNTNATLDVAAGGQVTATAGLAVNSGSSLNFANAGGFTTPGVSLDNSTLRLTGTNALSLGGISVSSNGGFLSAGTGVTFPVGVKVTGAGGIGVNWDTGGVVVLSNTTNDYKGDTWVGTSGPGAVNAAGSSATLRIGDNNVVPHGATFGNVGFHIDHVATLDLNGKNLQINGLYSDQNDGPGTVLSSNAIITNSVSATTSILEVGNNNADNAFRGLIKGNISLHKVGSGTQRLYDKTGGSNYTGDTIVTGGIIQFFQGSNIGTGNITLDGGELWNSGEDGNNTLNVTLDASRTVTLGAGGGFVRSGYGRSFTINSKISGPGGFGIAWDGNLVVVAAANDYLGLTTIGTNGNGYWTGGGAGLTLGITNGIPSGGDLTFGVPTAPEGMRNTDLNLAGFNQTLGALNGQGNATIHNDGTVANPSALTVASGNFSGVIRDGNSTIALTKVGPGTLTLAGDNSFKGGTNISAGILATTHLNALGGPAASAVVGAAGTLQADAPGLNLLALNNAGTANFTGGNSAIKTITGTGSLTVGPVGTSSTSLAVTSLRQANLTVNSGNGISYPAIPGLALATRAAGGKTMVLGVANPANNNSSVPGTLTIGSAGVLDISDGLLAIHTAQDFGPIKNAVMAKVQTDITAANNPSGGGFWDGQRGLWSSAAVNDPVAHGIGYADNFNQLYPTWGPDNEPVTDSSVLVRYTLLGDANLDGKVDVADLSVVLPNFGMASGATWEMGDFNYDGRVDVADLSVMLPNYGQSLPFLDPGLVVSANAIAAESGPLSAVPEPGALTLLGLGALGLIRRKRRA